MTSIPSQGCAFAGSSHRNSSKNAVANHIFVLNFVMMFNRASRELANLVSSLSRGQAHLKGPPGSSLKHGDGDHARAAPTRSVMTCVVSLATVATSRIRAWSV